MKIKKLNIFQKISLLNKIAKAWKEIKALIDGNKGLTEEARQIALELIALFERIQKLFPCAKPVIEKLIEIIKNALG
jgi:regulator of replication initiation timing